jgi:hypothetical protein
MIDFGIWQGHLSPAIHWLHLFSGTAWFSAGFASGGLSSLGCGIFLSGRKFVEIEPDTLVIIDILL